MASTDIIRTVVRKLVAGGPGRPTRLHTESGRLIPVYEMRHLPKSIFRKLVNKATGIWPDEPWWPMSVIPLIDAHLTPFSNVLEFGSGASTIWLAKRAATVISFEDNSDWQKKVSHRLLSQRLGNAEVRLVEDYYRLRHIERNGFDLAVIDGSYRWKCVEAVLPLMKSGGMVYLDNSDADKDVRFYPDPTMHHCAQSVLQKYAAANPKSTLRRFASIINGEIHAGEGIILIVS